MVAITDVLFQAMILVCTVHTQGSFTPLVATEIQMQQKTCVADLIDCYKTNSTVQQCLRKNK